MSSCPRASPEERDARRLAALRLRRRLQRLVAPAEGRLEVVGGGVDTKALLGADVEVAARRTATVRAHVDSLELRRGDRGIVLQKPCDVGWDSGASRLVVEGLELRGQLGLVKGDLALTPQQVSGEVSWTLGMPMSVVRDLLPPNLLFAAKAESVACDGRLSLSGSAADPVALVETSVEMRDAQGVPALAGLAKAWLRSPAATPLADWPPPRRRTDGGLAARVSLRQGETTIPGRIRAPAGARVAASRRVPSDGSRDGASSRTPPISTSPCSTICCRPATR
jgi:hypothetical protein